MISFAPDTPPDGVDFVTAEWVLRQLVLLSQSFTSTQERIDDTGGLQDQIDALALNIDYLQQQIDDIVNVVVCYSQQFTGLAGQTTITLSPACDINDPEVHLDGCRMTLGEDFTYSGNTITLTYPIQYNDSKIVVSESASSISNIPGGSTLSIDLEGV